MTLHSKYDYTLDGKPHRLVQGEHFTGDRQALRETLHKLAKRRGCRVRTRFTKRCVWVERV